MYANLASGILIVIGAVMAVLGFLLAANLLVVGIGLLAVLAGGVLSIAARRS